MRIWCDEPSRGVKVARECESFIAASRTQVYVCWKDPRKFSFILTSGSSLARQVIPRCALQFISQ
jgi:hypothetical protein